MINYFEEYEKSKDFKMFWKEKALDLHWSKAFKKIYNDDFQNSKWFEDGELNACFNCVDRNYKKTPNKVAVIFEDNSGKTVKITYKQLLVNVIRVTNIIRKINKKGQCATIYMGMCPEAIFSILACARMGVSHNVVFGGYSVTSLKIRIEDSDSKLIITTDFCNRGIKKINFLDTVLKAIDQKNLPVLVFNSEEPVVAGDVIYYTGSADKYKNFFIDDEDCDHVLKNYEKTETVPGAYEIVNNKKIAIISDSFFPCEEVNAEFPLFYLYTSGSTGKPKGLLHTTGGYLAYARYTTKMAFSIEENDIFFCTADIGWITGHTYCVYGPLSLGITTVVMEGLPTFPDITRFFRMVDLYKITQLYTAPTTIRFLKKLLETDTESLGGHKDLRQFSLSSIKLLGSVGEPLNKEAYAWFREVFNKRPIVDCYWQTETGGIIIASVSNGRPTKPECAGMPMPGIFPRIGEDSSRNHLGNIYITKTWPGIARTIVNNKERYLQGYFERKIYFTGDEGVIDEDENTWVKGRADDVINVSGHRISTAEVESAACTNEFVAEAAVIEKTHEIKGSCIILFCVLKNTEKNLIKKINLIKNSHLIRIYEDCHNKRHGKSFIVPDDDYKINKVDEDLLNRLGKIQVTPAQYKKISVLDNSTAIIDINIPEQGYLEISKIKNYLYEPESYITTNFIFNVSAIKIYDPKKPIENNSVEIDQNFISINNEAMFRIFNDFEQIKDDRKYIKIKDSGFIDIIYNKNLNFDNFDENLFTTKINAENININIINNNKIKSSLVLPENGFIRIYGRNYRKIENIETREVLVYGNVKIFSLLKNEIKKNYIEIKENKNIKFINNEPHKEKDILILNENLNEAKVESIFKHIVKTIGGIARPEKIVVVKSIPKTATGKIMRRILRNIVQHEEYGDLSTCVNKEIIQELEEEYCKSVFE